MMRQFVLVMVAVVALATACDSKKGAVANANSEPPTREQPGGGPEAAQLHKETHERDEVHLGEQMYELSRRFSAVWFAGKAGNAAMVDYQLHEMHEVIEQLERARPMEGSVDIAARLERDVEAHFDELEEAAGDGDQKKFETTYKTVVANCSSCHVETNHPFIQVTIPEYNPYPNIKF